MRIFSKLNIERKRRLSFNRHPSTALSVPSFIKKTPALAKAASVVGSHLNFYRLHMLCFVFIPLIAAGIFYASNEEHTIGYTDSLFMCMSAMTVTGLNSVLLGDLTRWQQVILFLLMTIGSPPSVSILTILIRRHFFKRKFEYLVQHDPEARRRVNEVEQEEAIEEHRSAHYIPSIHRASTDDRRLSSAGVSEKPKKKKKKKKHGRVRPDMITRVDRPPPLPTEDLPLPSANTSDFDGPSAPVSSESSSEDEGEGGSPLTRVFTEEPAQMTPVAESFEEQHGFPITASTAATDARGRRPRPRVATADGHRAIQIEAPTRDRDRVSHLRRNSDPWGPDHRNNTDPFPRTRTVDHRSPSRMRDLEPPPSAGANGEKFFPRTRTIEFRSGEDGMGHQFHPLRRQRTYVQPDLDAPPFRSPNAFRGAGVPRTVTSASGAGVGNTSALTSGFGGFPNPVVAAAGLVRRNLPKLERTVTVGMHRTTTFASTHSDRKGGISNAAGAVKAAPYITFDAVVGRNSRFHNLTNAQQEELGGVEYRALTMLLRVVVGYWFGIQLIAVLCVAPWLENSRTYQPVFEEPAWSTNPTWFVFFQVWSAFSNTGMSIIDASMIPFQRAYWFIIVLSFLILAGNTAYPIFLRALIFFISKVVPAKSKTHETLRFLLDHPRRCYIYLFPSTQTWFLFFVLVVLNSIDWVSFLVLDIGNPIIDGLPVGTRMLAGLFQGFAVRAAGFAIVPLAELAPAVQMLYAVMMYIAVYPIAMSIRSTNVYEEKSMGVFDEEDGEDQEAKLEQTHSATTYIAYHARKQLAFDMWWLVFSIWLVCIVERRNINDDASPWINIFSVVFEISSAYGTVGLSLGSGTKNTSLTGDLRPLSKLIICVVMLRGRHRGLPIAIDRAVLLPSDLIKIRDDTVSYASAAEKQDRKTAAGLFDIPPLTDAERYRSQSGGEELGQTLELQEKTKEAAVSEEGSSRDLSDKGEVKQG